MHDIPEAQVGGFPALDYAPPASMAQIRQLKIYFRGTWLTGITAGQSLFAEPSFSSTLLTSNHSFRQM